VIGVIGVIGVGAVEAPWGPIHVAVDADAVVALEVMTTDDGFASSIGRRFGDVAEASPGGAVGRRLAAATDAVERYLAGQPESLARLPFALHGLTDWDRLVLDGVRRVPWGEVTSYGRLAREIGRPGAARAVGGAVGRNPVGLIVPCHRVIAGDGSLGGYGGSWLGDRDALLTIKRRLLALEDAAVGPGAVTWTTFEPRHG
jgi:methylated-DNA-[protein]-cysteine S-methyltransferase